MNAVEVLMARSRLKPVFNGSPTLAKNYDNRDVRGWWWSEKLDGIRAIWNGKNLVTRNNNIINCPSSWLSTLPKDLAFDGELYIARGKFNKTVSILLEEQYPPLNGKRLSFIFLIHLLLMVIMNSVTISWLICHYHHFVPL